MKKLEDLEEAAGNVLYAVLIGEIEATTSNGEELLDELRRAMYGDE